MGRKFRGKIVTFYTFLIYISLTLIGCFLGFILFQYVGAVLGAIIGFAIGKLLKNRII